MSKLFNSRSEQITVVAILSVLTFCITFIVSVAAWGNPKPASLGGALVAASIVATLGTLWVFAGQRRGKDGKFGGKSLWIIIGLSVLFTPGCSGVNLNATYSNLLTKTAALSRQDANEAKAGIMSPEDMTRSLESQAVAWQRFLDASKGIE